MTIDVVIGYGSSGQLETATSDHTPDAPKHLAISVGHSTSENQPKVITLFLLKPLTQSTVSVDS